jgi:hypothetical protein
VQDKGLRALYADYSTPPSLYLIRSEEVSSVDWRNLEEYKISLRCRV